MDGTVNILEVHIGTAVFRACADLCPPAGTDRRRFRAERRAEADQIERQLEKATTALHGTDSSWTGIQGVLDLERRHSILLGLYAPRRVNVDPSSAAGLPADEVVRQVREQLRQEDEEDGSI